MTSTNYHPPNWLSPEFIPSPELCEQVKAAAAAIIPLRDTILAYIAEHRPAFQAYHAWTGAMENRPNEHFDVCDEMMGYSTAHINAIALGEVLIQLAEDRLDDNCLEGWD